MPTCWEWFPVDKLEEGEGMGELEDEVGLQHTSIFLNL